LGGVDHHHRVVRGRAFGGEDAHQPLDLRLQPGAPLVQRALRRQLQKQVAKLTLGRAQEPAVARNPHHHLGDTQGHDLGICQLPAPVPRLLRQEIIRRAINTRAEQVEVGVHRGLRADGVLDTADFDLSAADPCTPPTTPQAVESII
jgi:hypothetical protein